MEWKNFWCGLNTALIFLLFMYVFICKDFNTMAYNKAVEVEKDVGKIHEDITTLKKKSDTKSDTIVVSNNFKITIKNE